jgi:hypothetical protein
MDTRTGQLVNYDELQESLRSQPEESKYFVPVRRDLSAKEKADMQIRLYAPCGCGSGKKFRFCCKARGASGQNGERTNGGPAL